MTASPLRRVTTGFAAGRVLRHTAGQQSGRHFLRRRPSRRIRKYVNGPTVTTASQTTTTTTMQMTCGPPRVCSASKPNATNVRKSGRNTRSMNLFQGVSSCCTGAG